MDKTILSELSTEQEKSNQRVGGAAMKNKWEKRIGVFALAAISSALMFSTNAITAKAADNEWTYSYTGNVQTFTVCGTLSDRGQKEMYRVRRVLFVHL